METPKEIYLTNSIIAEGSVNGYVCTDYEQDKTNVKYIRADIKELTWDDIRMLVKDIAEPLWNENENGFHPLVGQPFWEEVLRRFNERKTK